MEKPGAFSGLFSMAATRRLGSVMRVVVTRMVVLVMMVMAGKRRHGSHDHHKQNERQQLFHERDYSHLYAGNNKVSTRTNQRQQ
jgi:uncharacterized membrane protein